MSLRSGLQDSIKFATSREARMTLVNAVLLVGFSTILFSFAVIASGLFYRNYVPQQVVVTPIHLQYGLVCPFALYCSQLDLTRFDRLGQNPFGYAVLTDPPFKSQQSYDISVTLNLPRSPINIDMGNFMVAIYLLDRGIHASSTNFKVEYHTGFDDKSVLVSSRRATIVPYKDPFISLASRMLFLFYYLFSQDSQVCTLKVPMVEDIKFTSGPLIPKSVYLELQAGQTIQIYDVSITATANLRGLRWLMYHYRLLATITLAMLFWTSEVFFMGFAWLAWTKLAQVGAGSSLMGVHHHKNRIGVDRKMDGNTYPSSTTSPPRVEVEPVHSTGIGIGVKMEEPTEELSGVVAGMTDPDMGSYPVASANRGSVSGSNYGAGESSNVRIRQPRSQ
jgi:seipin